MAVLPALTAVLLFCAAGSNLNSAGAGEGSPVAPTMELTVFPQTCPCDQVFAKQHRGRRCTSSHG